MANVSLCFLAVLVVVFHTPTNAQLLSPTQREATLNTRGNGEKADAISVPLESPEPGVRLYGTSSLFATWTHTDLSPDGQWLVGFQGTRMLVWDRQAGRIAREFDVIENGSVAGTVFSPDGNYLAIFVRQWLDLPVLKEDADANEAATDESLDALLTTEPKFQSQVLIYDHQWRLVGEFDVAPDYLDFPAGMTFAPDESAVLVRGREDYDRDTVVIIDLKLKLATTAPTLFYTPIWIDSQKVACPRTRETWNYRTDKVGRLPDDFMPRTYRAYPMSDNGDWVLIHSENGHKLLQLSTKREISLLDFSGYAFGHVSPDNRYFVLVAYIDHSRKALWLDLTTETEIARAEAWQVSLVKFVRNESAVHLSLTGYGTGTRARSVTMATVPLDENFPAALHRAQMALPVTDKVLFAAQDRWLVLSNGWSWIELETGELAGLARTTSRIAQVAAHPDTEQVFTFGTPADSLNNVDELSITEQSRQPNQGRSLFTIQPPTEIMNFLLWLMGSETDSNPRWSLSQQHLSTSNDGKQLRIVHSESKSIGNGVTDTRYQLTMWDVQRRKKISMNTLEAPEQKPYTPMIVNLSPDSQTFGIANANRICWGDAETGQLTKEVHLPGFATSFEFSADNRFVAVGLAHAPWQLGWRWPIHKNMPLAHEIAVIEMETGLIRFQKKNVEVVGFGFQTQSHELYILDRNHQPRKKRLTIYKPDSWEAVFEHQTEYSQPLAMALSSDGKLIAITLADTRVEVWDLAKIQAN